MDRRNLLKLAGTAAMAHAAAACDKLVLVDGAGRLDSLDPITPNDMFYVYACCGLPTFDPSTHETVINHETTELGRFTRSFLESLGKLEKEHTLECIGSGPRIQNIGNTIWGGRPLIDVLDALGVVVPASAVGLRLVGMDDYHAGLPIDDLLRADDPIWIAWEMDGAPLTDWHGAPARLIVPGRYGVKNLKWIREIAFVDTPHTSYWTERGWSEEATYKPNTFIQSPPEGSTLTAGERVLVLGTAYAGRDPVARVEVSVDGGPWQDAVLDYATGEPDIWVLWSFVWTATEGDHTVQARCFTESGAVSSPNAEGTDRYAGYDGSMAVLLSVMA